jgi:hypothetical protein
LTKLIGNADWLPGDRERQSANGKEKEKYICPEPENVESTYGHQWISDPDWYQKILPRPSLYVNAFLECVDRITEKPYWDISVVRVRLVGKHNARLSVIISGVEDRNLKLQRKRCVLNL